MAAATKIEIGSGTIFRTLLIVAGVWLLFVLRDIVLLLFGTFILASALEPPVNWLHQRKIPRAVSVLLLYLVLILLLVGVLALMVGPITEQTAQLVHVAPSAINQVTALLPLDLPQLNEEAVLRWAQDSIIRFGGNVANVGVNVLQRTRAFFGGFFTLLLMFVLTFYLVMERDAVKKFARIVTPAQHLKYVEHVITRTQRGIGRWVLGILVLGTVVGTVVGTGLWILGVPYALLLGVLAGVFEVVPVVGPIVAGVVGVTVALSQSFSLALLALGLYLITNALENYLLVPNVMKKAVGIKPLATIIAVVIGGSLGGVVGVILAVPVAAILAIIGSDLLGSQQAKS